MRYCYFISFMFNEGLSGGNTVIHCKYKIESSEDVDNIQKQIEEKGSFDKVIIMNIVLLGKR